MKHTNIDNDLAEMEKIEPENEREVEELMGADEKELLTQILKHSHGAVRLAYVLEIKSLGPQRSLGL